MSTNHSTLHSPSSAWLRRLCPGSARACAVVPNEENEFMREGRDAHHVAEIAVRQGAYSIPPGHGYTYDQLKQMVKAAEIYASHVHNISGNNPINIESRLDISNIHPDCFGTCDAWYYDEANKQVHIWDFKYGRKAIEVKENWQMIEYAAGVVIKLQKIFNDYCDPSYYAYSKLRSKFMDNLNFNFHIVQPRAKHENGIIRTWKIRFINLINYFDEAEEFENIADRLGAPLVAGDHCQNCRARFGCQAFKDTALLTGVSFTLPPSYGNIGLPGLAVDTPQGISNELTYLREAQVVLDTRVKALTEQAMSSIKQGQSIPGYKIMPSLSRSQWSAPAHVVDELGKMHGCNLMKPQEPVTPSQAIAMGMPADLVSMNCKKEITGEKLVECEDE